MAIDWMAVAAGTQARIAAGQVATYPGRRSDIPYDPTRGNGPLSPNPAEPTNMSAPALTTKPSVYTLSPGHVVPASSLGVGAQTKTQTGVQPVKDQPKRWELYMPIAVTAPGYVGARVPAVPGGAPTDAKVAVPTGAKAMGLGLAGMPAWAPLALGALIVMQLASRR